MELGPGVIILLITWLLTGLTWLLFLRSQSSVRAFVTAVAALLTVILILIPTESVHLKEWDRSHENFDVDPQINSTTRKTKFLIIQLFFLSLGLRLFIHLESHSYRHPHRQRFGSSWNFINDYLDSESAWEWTDFQI